MAEFTYNNLSMDADLTLIDQIGVTMSMRMQSPGGLIQGSYRDTGCLVDIVNDLSNATPTNMAPWSTTGVSGGIVAYLPGEAPSSMPTAGTWTPADLQGNPNWLRILGPTQNASGYPSTQAYATSVTGPLTINDMLGDATYNGEFSYTATLADSTWTLNGTLTPPSGTGTLTGPTILVNQAGLYGPDPKAGTGYQLYAQNGPFYASWTPAWPFRPPTHSPAPGWLMGARRCRCRTPSKSIYRDFIAAFSYGYWGSSLGGGTNTGTYAANFTGNPLDAGLPCSPA